MHPFLGFAVPKPAESIRWWRIDSATFTEGACQRLLTYCVVWPSRMLFSGERNVLPTWVSEYSTPVTFDLIAFLLINPVDSRLQRALVSIRCDASSRRRISSERSCPSTKDVRIAVREFGECGGVNSKCSMGVQINCGFGVSAALGKQLIDCVGALRAPVNFRNEPHEAASLDVARTVDVAASKTQGQWT